MCVVMMYLYCKCMFVINKNYLQNQIYVNNVNNVNNVNKLKDVYLQVNSATPDSIHTPAIKNDILKFFALL